MDRPLIAQLLLLLDERDKKVLLLRILADKPMPLKALGAKLRPPISYERARQLEKALRRRMVHEGGDLCALIQHHADDLPSVEETYCNDKLDFAPHEINPVAWKEENNRAHNNFYQMARNRRLKEHACLRS